MMHEAQTPEGKLFWLSDTVQPLVGSPLVILRLREASEAGIQAFWPGDPVAIDLANFSDVRFALDVIYKDQVTYSPDAPEASQLVPPIDPQVIY